MKLETRLIGGHGTNTETLRTKVSSFMYLFSTEDYDIRGCDGV